MAKDYPVLRRDLLKDIGVLREAEPATMAAFAELGKATYREGALSKKFKELLALAIAITDRCDGCIAFHVRSACGAGATRDEVSEAIAVAIQMGGGPSMVYGAEALSAFDQFCSKT